MDNNNCFIASICPISKRKICTLSLSIFPISLSSLSLILYCLLPKSSLGESIPLSFFPR